MKFCKTILITKYFFAYVCLKFQCIGIALSMARIILIYWCASSSFHYINNCAGVMRDLGINLPPRTVSRQTLRHLLSNPKTICLWRKFYYIGFGKRKLQVTFRKFSQYISIKYPGVPAVQTTQDSILFNFSHLNTHFNFLIWFLKS